MMLETNKIYVGDCIDVMKTWPENFVDTIITDPPYGLSFMGKDWDHGIPGPHFWAEALRIAKPGAFLLAFGGTRTFHRLTVAIEDAGWEIRDCMMWLYGSGFPKSRDISKDFDKDQREVIGTQEAPGMAKTNVDQGAQTRTTTTFKKYGEPVSDLAKQWSGWGTALKPAWEPIIVAMKPLDGTFAENAEKWGVAGINVDGGRIAGSPDSRKRDSSRPVSGNGIYHERERTKYEIPVGRWPANLILDEDAAAMLDGQSGELTSGTLRPYEEKSEAEYKQFHSKFRDVNRQGSTGGASRFFYVAKADRAERNEGCDGLQPEDGTTIGRIKNRVENGVVTNPRKSSVVRANIHPTVKPLSLMKYLCQLTRTPTGGIVLDPFAGSGTTLWAAEYHNRPWIGIEMNPEYVAIANARIARERAQMKMAI